MNQDSGPALLSADALELWRGDRCLFRDLSLSVGEGELLHVRGPNGSGKTSLLRVLSGLSLPEKGVVRWQGIDVRRCRDRFHAGFAWLGHLNGFKAELTAIENLRFATGLRHEVTRSQFAAATDRMGIAAGADLPGQVLSAGQKRRLAMAAVILSGAQLWMLDEPFTNLDAGGRDLISELLDQHCAGGGAAIVAAHQDLGVAPSRVRFLDMAVS